MKNIYSLILLAFCTFATINAQAPAASNAIMLQGFYWDSNSATSWSQLYQISGDLSGYFDYVWLPPSAMSSGGTGYMPRQLSNQTSSWGNVDDLKRLINYLKAHQCKAIADIVVNHRDGMSSWCNFYPDNFGTFGSFQLTASHICSNDEVNSAAGAGSCRGQATGAPDTGENFDGARDLDHTQTYVRDATKAYLKWMKSEMGYDGWRYDMAKGFSASYFGEYSDAGNADLSVGEYWDGEYNAVWNWINGTGNKSMAFDFPMKYAALNNGLAGGNYGAMAWNDGATPRPAGLIHSPQSRRYSVTFVDNHDTYRDGSKYTGDVQKANAFILSSPGIPCVFYPHWRDNKTAIQNMMKARKAVGLNSESTVTVQNTSGYYKAYSEGTYGEMLTYIGSSSSAWASDAPSGGGWTLNCSGSGWAMYTKVTNTAGQTAYQNKIDAGVNPVPDTPFDHITLCATVPAAWTAPKIHVWAVGGSQITTAAWPGDAMTNIGGNKWTISLSGFTASQVGVVINNGAATPAQTEDLFAKGDTGWIIDATPTGPKHGATVDASCLTSGITNIDANQFMIYPNPVKDELFFTSSSEKNNVEILDITGKTVVNLKSNSGNSVDVSNLTSGIYFIKIGNNIGKFVKK
ncbi:MAG: alpha-amylase family glycosyl hydrolase [Paludibacter sp.]|nr:alpha-amylase family glycosyl hydrolase [Paludibacter sp.]